MSKMVVDKDLCNRWWLTKLRVTKMVVDKVVCGRRRRRRRRRQRRRPDTESKTRTPHKDVGEKTTILAPVIEKEWVGILIQGVRGGCGAC